MDLQGIKIGPPLRMIRELSDPVTIQSIDGKQINCQSSLKPENSKGIFLDSEFPFETVTIFDRAFYSKSREIQFTAGPNYFTAPKARIKPRQPGSDWVTFDLGSFQTRVSKNIKNIFSDRLKIHHSY